jgi:glycosyltransferase involved in cell wall biosynthesis
VQSPATAQPPHVRRPALAPPPRELAVVAGNGGNSLDCYARELVERLHLPLLSAPGSTGSFGHSLLSRESLRRAAVDLDVVRRLRRAHVQAVHLTSHHLARYGPFAGVPYVVTVHDLIRLTDWWERGREDPLIHKPNLRDGLHLLADASGIRRAAAVVAVSERTAEEVVARLDVPAGRVHVIPEGVDTTRFTRVAPPPGTGRYLLFVGTEQPRKNLGTLVTALARLLSDPRNADLRLVKIGGPGGPEAPYRRCFLEEAWAAGVGDRLVLTERVSHAELLSWYSGAECLVLPSVAEGFGLPVLEAMACGCPVVVPDRSAQADVGGAAAVRYRPARDASSLAAVVAQLLDAPRYRRQLGRRGLERAKELSWERTVEATLAVYESVLKRGSRARAR